MTEQERAREKRKTLIAVIITAGCLVIIIGLIITGIIFNPLGLNSSDAMTFKSQALSSFPVTIIILGMFPLFIGTAAIFYTIGRRHGSASWRERIPEKSKERITELAHAMELKSVELDYKSREIRRLKKRVNNMETEKKAIYQTVIADYEDLQEGKE